jgi:hypothetical protein
MRNFQDKPSCIFPLFLHYDTCYIGYFVVWYIAYGTNLYTFTFSLHAQLSFLISYVQSFLSYLHYINGTWIGTLGDEYAFSLEGSRTVFVYCHSLFFAYQTTKTLPKEMVKKLDGIWRIARI